MQRHRYAATVVYESHVREASNPTGPDPELDQKRVSGRGPRDQTDDNPGDRRSGEQDPREPRVRHRETRLPQPGAQSPFRSDIETYGKRAVGLRKFTKQSDVPEPASSDVELTLTVQESLSAQNEASTTVEELLNESLRSLRVAPTTITFDPTETLDDVPNRTDNGLYLIYHAILEQIVTKCTDYSLRGDRIQPVRRAKAVTQTHDGPALSSVRSQGPPIPASSRSRSSTRETCSRQRRLATRQSRPPGRAPPARSPPTRRSSRSRPSSIRCWRSSAERNTRCRS